MATPFIANLRRQVAARQARDRERERARTQPSPPPPKGATTPTRASTRKAGKAARKQGGKTRRAVVQRARPPAQASPGVSPETRRNAAQVQTPEARARREREARRNRNASPGVDAATRRNAARAQTPEARRRRGQQRQAVSAEQREFLADVAAVRRAERAGPDVVMRGQGLVGFEQWLANMQEQANRPSPFLGGFLENFGRGAVEAATSVPSMLQLGGQALAYGPLAAADAAMPDNNLVGGIVKNTREGIEENLKAAGTGIKDDYAYRYGPLFEGNFGEFASRYYDDPFGTTLDVAGGASIVGKAPSAAARGVARVAPEGSQLADRARNFNSILGPGERIPGTNRVTTKAGARHRPPKTITGSARGVTKKGEPRPESRTITIPQRPYSSNVVTRKIQKGATKVNRKVIAPRVERAAARRQVADGERVSVRTAAVGRAAQGLTEQAKFNRHMKRTVREKKLAREQAAAQKYAEISAPFNRAVRRLRPDKTAAGVRSKGPDTEALATRMHLEGVLAPRAGVSPVALRDRAVATMRDGLERRRAAGERVEPELRQLAALERIPEELLTLVGDAPAVKRVRHAVAEGRRLDAEAQAMEVASKVITKETAKERGSLSSRMLLAGQQDAGNLLAAMRRAKMSKRDQNRVRSSSIRDTPQVVALRGKVAEAERRLDLVEGKTDPAPLRAALSTARADLRKAEAAHAGRLRTAKTAAKTERKTARLAETKVRRGMGGPGAPRRARGPLTREQHAAVHGRRLDAEARVAEVKAGSPKKQRREVRKMAKDERLARFADADQPKAIKAATRKRDDLRKQLRKAEDESLGFTPPTRPELVGHQGVYIPHVRLRKGVRGSRTAGGGRLSGPAAPKRSTGTLVQDGVIDMNPALLSHQAKRAAQHSVGPMSREALDELIGLAAFTDDAGKPIAGGRALRLAQTDPEQVALVRVGALQDALRKLDDAPVGQTITRADMDAAVISGKDLIDRIDGAKKGDYIAISKAAADEWRAMPFTGDNRFFKGYDWTNDNWKGAILALSPRWYVNSGFGVALQYGLLAGGDIRSIFQANRRSRGVRDAIPTREAINTLAQDVGFKGKLDANKIQRGMQKGFEVNNRMETLWRRAAYVNRAKQHLRRENPRAAKYTDAELAHALTHMPPSLARQITREVDLYMGEFRKFNAFEREVMKRVIPFYSWMRVITRISFGLPFRSPIRAAALSTATKAGMLGISPEDYMRPIYDRGAIVLPGGLRLRSSGWNNLYTLVPFVEALGAMKGPGDWRPVAKEFGGWMNPVLRTIVSQATGTNSFGDDVFAPRGPRKYINAVTGTTELSKDGIPIMEAILQAAIPAQAGGLRRVLVGTETAYDTTSTVDLLMYRMGLRDDTGLFYKRTGKPVNTKVGPGGAASTIPGSIGFPVSREDPGELQRRFKKGQQEARREAKKDAARKRRESR